MHRYDVGVLELPGNLRFRNEAIAIHRLAGELFIQPL